MSGWSAVVLGIGTLDPIPNLDIATRCQVRSGPCCSGCTTETSGMHAMPCSGLPFPSACTCEWQPTFHFRHVVVLVQRGPFSTLHTDLPEIGHPLLPQQHPTLPRRTASPQSLSPTAVLRFMLLDLLDPKRHIRLKRPSMCSKDLSISKLSRKEEQKPRYIIVNNSLLSDYCLYMLP